MNALPSPKIKTALLIAIAAATTYGGSLLAQDANGSSPFERFSYRDNKVQLVVKTNGYELLGGTYTLDDLSITRGQDPDGVNKKGDVHDVSGDGKIAFKVGRKGSTEVAEWFSRNLALSNYTFNHPPGELNFAFAGKLEINLQGPGLNSDTPVVLDHIYFAQGKSGTSNNWWFGGSGCTRTTEKYLDQVTCSSSSYPTMKFKFTRGRTGYLTKNSVDKVNIDITQ